MTGHTTGDARKRHQPKRGVIRHEWDDGLHFFVHADDLTCNHCEPPDPGPGLRDAMAEAWDEGRLAFFSHNTRFPTCHHPMGKICEHFVTPPNPYRAEGP